jgi:predicted HTH domain antitoxin
MGLNPLEHQLTAELILIFKLYWIWLSLCKREIMKGMICIEYPESLASALGLSGKDFESEMKVSSLVKLYELGKVSSGVAARVLGLSRLDFFDLLAKYKVSILESQDMNDLKQDISNA